MGGQEGAIAPGRQRERAPKEGGCSQGRGATNMTYITFAPGRQKPWRRHWGAMAPLAAPRNPPMITRDSTRQSLRSYTVDS
jgi:hypothetical protein